MDKTISIGLSGHPERFHLEADADDVLSRYLDRAAARLHDDPDEAEIIGDLEQSIGDKLAALVGSDDRLITVTDIDGVLEEIGAVDTGREPGPAPTDAVRTPHQRRLTRIRQGQMMAGVCTGLAAYSEIRVDWVRTIFVFAALMSAGLFMLVYIAMAFILPVAETRER
jgi:phage shock protein PspC (stress-responsive transcriptional regulator)